MVAMFVNGSGQNEHSLERTLNYETYCEGVGTNIFRRNFMNTLH
jgi:hypothetical protein